MKPHIRLLAVDIDGTLLDSHYQVSAANVDALRRAHAAGIEVVLGTGRRHSFAMPIAEALGFDLWLISSNGAITKSSRGEVFHRDLLPAGVARRLLTHMAAFRANTVLTFDREHRGAIVVESREELHSSIRRWMEKNDPYIQQLSPLEDSLVEDPIQVMFCGALERMKQAQERLATGDYIRDITLLRTIYEPRDLALLDIINRDCSKGHALERWARHRGFHRDQVMAIGDNYNDVEMLVFAGLPFIMGNASEDLKQNGWRVTLGNDHSGVAAALEAVGI